MDKVAATFFGATRNALRAIPDFLLVGLQVVACAIIVPPGIGDQQLGFTLTAYAGGLLIILPCRLLRRTQPSSDRMFVLFGFLPLYVLSFFVAHVIWEVKYPLLLR